MTASRFRFKAVSQLWIYLQKLSIRSQSFRVFGMDFDVYLDFKLRSNMIVCFKNFKIWNAEFHDPIFPQQLQCRVHIIAYSNFSQECQVCYKTPDSSFQAFHHTSCHLANQRETWRFQIYNPLHENPPHSPLWYVSLRVGGWNVECLKRRKHQTQLFKESLIIPLGVLERETFLKVCISISHMTTWHRTRYLAFEPSDDGCSNILPPSPDYCQESKLSDQTSTQWWEKKDH